MHKSWELDLVCQPCFPIGPENWSFINNSFNSCPNSQSQICADPSFLLDWRPIPISLLSMHIVWPTFKCSFAERSGMFDGNVPSVCTWGVSLLWMSVQLQVPNTQSLCCIIPALGRSCSVVMASILVANKNFFHWKNEFTEILTLLF